MLWHNWSLKMKCRGGGSLERQMVLQSPREQGATRPPPLVPRAHSHRFESWPDYDGNRFPAAEDIWPFLCTTSLPVVAQSFWKMFWSTQHRVSIQLQEKPHGKGLLMRSVAKDMPSFVTFEQVQMAPSPGTPTSTF